MWEFVDKIIYINLDHRGDRRIHMNDFFIRGNVPSEKILRLPAVYHQYGAIGCSASHIRAITLAKNAGWNRVLILEDDVEWQNFEENYKKLDELITLPNWDVCMLGGIFSYVDPPRVTTAFCTHAYIVNKHYYDTILANFKQSHSLLKRTKSTIHWVRSQARNNTYGEYNLDSYWVKLQMKDYWIYIDSLCIQIDSYSDIVNVVRSPETIKNNVSIVSSAGYTIRKLIENGDI